MTIVCDNEQERKSVESQVKIIIRPLYSNPPVHGARVTTEILSNPKYYSKWFVLLKTQLWLIKYCPTCCIVICLKGC